MSFIETYSGEFLHFDNPNPDAIDILDIAHALSNVCRYAGHTSMFYSVAEHSCIVADLLYQDHGNKELALMGLLHDAAEAYLGDVTRPLKLLLPNYPPLEKKIMDVVLKKFGSGALTPTAARAIKQVDNQVLLTEGDRIMMKGPSAWSWVPDVKERSDIPIRYWVPALAKKEFLHRFHKRYR